MVLPKPKLPEYSTTIPSTGKKIKYQPFTVREERVLVSAASSEDPDEIANAIANVLENSVTTPEFKAADLALFDIEYLFLKTRSKSVGEKIDVIVTDPEDETYSTTKSIYVDKIGVEKTEGHKSLIELGDDMSIQMRYPDITFFSDGIDTTNLNGSIDVICRCVESIIVGEEVYNRVDMTTEEIEEWLEGLTTEQFRSITEFFDTMPKLRHVVICKNENTGKDFRIVLEGLADFF